MVIKVRQAIESRYEGECDIFEYEPIKDPVTKITKHQEQSVITNQPCRLSFQRITTTKQTETASAVDLVGKVFLSPDVSIKAGSKVVVTQYGQTFVLKSSGEPAIYSSHQEVMLELFMGWS